MAFRIAGTITLFLSAKINTTSSRKNAATIKKPPALLSIREPIHSARPQKVKKRKKIPNRNAAMPMAAPEAASEAPCVAFALAN